MKHIVIATALFFFLAESMAQTINGDSTKPIKKKIFKTFIYGNDSLQSAGYFLYVADSIIYLSNAPVAFQDKMNEKYRINKVDLSQVDIITVKRNGVVARSAGIGAIAGIGFGLFLAAVTKDGVGFMSGFGEKARAFGISFGILGVGIGTLIGLLSPQKFFIYKDRQRLKEFNQSMLNKL